MAQKKVMRLASRGQRFGAALIDKVPWWILKFVFAKNIISRVTYAIMMELGYLYSYYGYSYNVPAVDLSVSPVWKGLLVIYLGAEIYFFTAGQSIGKAILGLRVVNDRTGGPLTAGYMLLREFIAKPACASILLLGYIWILIDDRNRGWHDKIFDTYVVDERAVVIQEEPQDMTGGYDPDRYKVVVKRAKQNQ